MPHSPTLMWAYFAMASSLVLLLFLLLSGRTRRMDQRLRALSGNAPAPEQDPVAEFARAALPRVGAALLPRDEEERTRLQTRLIHAGLYGRQAMVVFLGMKVLLMGGPAVLGLAAGLVGLVPTAEGVIGGALLGGFGMIAPSFWLDQMKARRQARLRRALPDALDVLVICLEGGMSFPGALRRLAGELRTAHPMLANELNIVQREVQMGRSTGEALRQFGERCDLEEIRSLASVVIQAERFGASLVKALRVHSETLRVKRLQRAEERAQQAATKLLIPTVLFIFPGIFIIVLAPAVLQIIDLFAKMKFKGAP